MRSPISLEVQRSSSEGQSNSIHELSEVYSRTEFAIRYRSDCLHHADYHSGIAPVRHGVAWQAAVYRPPRFAGELHDLRHQRRVVARRGCARITQYG